MNEKQLLNTCRVFHDLSPAQLGKIAALGNFAEYDAGTAIFSEKSPAAKLCVLDHGAVALQMQMSATTGAAGRRLTIEILRQTDAFGWSAVVESHPYTLTAVCIEHTRVLEIDGARLQMLMEEDSNLGYRVLKGVVKLVATRLNETRRLLVSERNALVAV